MGAFVIRWDGLWGPVDRSQRWSTGYEVDKELVLQLIREGVKQSIYFLTLKEDKHTANTVFWYKSYTRL